MSTDPVAHAMQGHRGSVEGRPDRQDGGARRRHELASRVDGLQYRPAASEHTEARRCRQRHVPFHAAGSGKCRCVAAIDLESV